MNWLALIAGAITLVLFLLHAIAGGRELALVAPAEDSSKAAEVRRQVVNGWHWVSVDLLLAGLAFVGIAVLRPAGDRQMLLGLAVYFFAVGAAWLVSTLATRTERSRSVLRLGQWIFCALLGALALLAR